jgi:hypothetical protein
MEELDALLDRDFRLPQPSPAAPHSEAPAIP